MARRLKSVDSFNRTTIWQRTHPFQKTVRRRSNRIMVSCVDADEQVLSILMESTSHSVGVPNSCTAFVVYGPLRLVHPLSSCGRLFNAKQLKNSIAVMNDGCTNLQKVQNIEKAGARGIVVLKTQVRRQPVTTHAMIGCFLCRNWQRRHLRSSKLSTYPFCLYPSMPTKTSCRSWPEQKQHRR